MKPFAVDDLFMHRTIKGLDGSPSHPQTVFVVSRALKDEDKYESTVWSLDTSAADSPRQLTMTLFDAKSPMLDPAGNTLAFLSQRDEDGGIQVQLQELDGGEARQLTNSERSLQSIEMWSTDGKHLLLTLGLLAALLVTLVLVLVVLVVLGAHDDLRWGNCQSCWQPK